MLVIFGITGDLAKVMTFRSLYRLEQRGLLDCPIVGVAVDDWTSTSCAQRARESIVGTGETLDEAVFDRFAARLSYVAGDFGDAATYDARRRGDREGEERRCSTSRSRRSCSARVVEGLARGGPDEDRAGRGREAVRPRPRVGPGARGRAAPVRRRVAALPHRPLPREDGPRGDPLPPLRELHARAALEPQLPRVRPDHDGRGLRRRGPRPLLRPGRRAARRRRQPPDAGRRGARRWRPPSAGDPETLKDAQRVALPRRSPTADPAHYVRGQYDGYLADRRRRSPTRRPRPTAALRLDIENWRWAGVPFFIRTGKRLPVTQTELRLVFKHPPQARLPGRSRMPEPNQLVVKLDPSTGIRLIVDAHRADTERHRRAIELDLEFAAQGGEGPTPYEVLLHAAMLGDSTRLHPPGRRRGGLADHAAAPRRSRRRCIPYAPGSWGPKEADDLVARPRHAGTQPWLGEAGVVSDYDVIIVGTGAGGGTLARHARRHPASASCCSSAATGCRASRRTGSPRTCSSTTGTSRPDTWYDTRARRSSRRCTTSSAARPSCTARPSTGCARRTSASCATTTASRPRGRSPTTSSSRTTRGPSSCTRCTARAARTRPSRRERAVPVSGRLARAADPAALRRPGRRPATTRSTRRAASGCTSRTCPTARASAVRTATASRAPCTASRTPRCSASGRRSSTRTSRC